MVDVNTEEFRDIEEVDGELLGDPDLLKRMRPKHRLLIRMHCLGISNVDIEQMLGHSPGYVSRILRSDLAQKQIAEFDAKLDDECVDTMQKVMLAKELIAEASPHLAIQLIEDGLRAEKASERTGATAQAFKIMTGLAGEEEEAGMGHGGLNIFINDSDGNMVRVDSIFPEKGQEVESTLAILKGKADTKNANKQDMECRLPTPEDAQVSTDEDPRPFKI